MTTNQTPRPATKPVSRPVGGPQKSAATAKASKTDAALQQLRQTVEMIDQLELLTREIETKFRSIDLSDFPKGDRALMERQIALAQASQWATLTAVTRAVEHAANGLKDDTMSPRDLRRKPSRKPTGMSTETPMGLSLEGLELMELPG
ncbi:hypothetical protein G6L68_25505 [Agrobacterium fabrum]|uniref:hypothetical protein n=1 Tax=Agrobacterium fabrum TaxID=1176649 RepID=UPI000EF5F273|nr:hypothetical protein [Agrobacterium fabrum]AYM66144.1 hypothetical protein At12D13_49920 [Agrobacterium fabrum]NTE63992.1 hypothetical protein [Agrobacterium fabrum]